MGWFARSEDQAARMRKKRPVRRARQAWLRHLKQHEPSVGCGFYSCGELVKLRVTYQGALDRAFPKRVEQRKRAEAAGRA